MMGIAEIRAINKRMTNRSRRLRKQPFVPTAEQKAIFATGTLNAPGAKIPFLADYVPKGWIKTEDEYFVDTSGWGADNEPALSMPRFAREVLATLPEGYGIGQTEQGQFQGYIAIYRPKEK